MSKIEYLERMVEALRRPRNDCESKSNQSPRYSNAVSALLWLINDLRTEERG